MLREVLGVLVLLGSGLTAGVLFCVALSVVPTLKALPPADYVHTHQLLGRNYDPTMPVIVLCTTGLDLVLAALAGDLAGRLLFAAGAALMFGVSVVSHGCNVPINRVVKSQDPARLPADWRDPRPRWSRWHLLRTGLALFALAANAGAVALPG